MTPSKPVGMSLYQIESDLTELMVAREEAEDDDGRAAVDQAIEEYAGRELRKVDSIRSYILHCEAQIKAAKTEGERIAMYRNSWEDRRDHLKAVCVSVIDRFIPSRRVEGHTGALRIQANGGPQLITIYDESLVPDFFKQTTVTMALQDWAGRLVKHATLAGIKFDAVAQISNARLRAALEAGEEVPGAHLEDRGQHLRIS